MFPTLSMDAQGSPRLIQGTKSQDGGWGWAWLTALRSYFWGGEHLLRHTTKRQDSPLLFPAFLVTEFALGDDFGWDQGMWEHRVRCLGFSSALEVSSQVASHSRIAYMNKDDGCSWLRVGAIWQSLYLTAFSAFCFWLNGGFNWAANTPILISRLSEH